MWFTDGFGVARIERVTTRGAITEYPLPAAGSRPSGIAAGPDGALWFTETRANKIGRITTSGMVTEYTVPARDKVQDGIAAGPDGALWFGSVRCEGQGEDLLCAGGKMERITTAGVITAFEIPTRVSFPRGITAGPDGAMWFTESVAGKIGRIAVPTELAATLKVSPRTGCTSSVVRAKAEITGAGKLARLTLSLDGRRRVRTDHRLLWIRIPVRSLAAGRHTLKAVAVDTAGSRSVVTQAFRRCRQAPGLTG